MTVTSENPPPTHGFNEPVSDAFNVRTLAGRYPRYYNLLSTKIIQDDTMDAIVVPASRPVEHISNAASLATSTDTMLITLCSGGVDSGQMAEALDAMSVPQWWAIDIPPGYENPAVDLVSELEIPEVSRRAVPSDLSDKRNVGLAISKMLGLRKILFMDDDVSISSQTLREASLMLTGRKIAGLRCGGFPDKAVVDHAESQIIWHHSSHSMMARPASAGHISGNSIAVNTQLADIFFPRKIYNEDLLAFYDLYSEGSAALADGSYYQARFDPFADPDRARTEEFGEVFTHGLYQHLYLRRSVELDDGRYWGAVIDERHDLIMRLLQGLDAPQNRRNFSYFVEMPTFEPVMKEKIRSSLLAALAVNAAVESKDCMNYYHAWREDQGRWRRHLSELPKDLSMLDAAQCVGLTTQASNID